MGNWTTITLGGGGTAAAVPAAPNIVSVSPLPGQSSIVQYTIWANSSAYKFACLIYLPTTNADYIAGHLKKIHVTWSAASAWAIGLPYKVGEQVLYGGITYVCLLANTGNQPNISPSYWLAGAAQPQELDSILAPWSSSPITYTSDFILQDDVLLGGTLSFLDENDDGIITRTTDSDGHAPLTVSLSIQASVATSVSAVDASTLPTGDPNYKVRWADIDGVTWAQINVSPVLNGNQVPQVVAIWLNFDDGNGWHLMAIETMTSVGQVFKYAVRVPTLSSTTAWQVGAQTGWVNQSAAVASLPSGTPTNSLTVGTSSPVAAGLFSLAFQNNGSGSLYDYAGPFDPGYYTWRFHDLDIVFPASAPDVWDINLYVQEGTVVGGVFTPVAGSKGTVRRFMSVSGVVNPGHSVQIAMGTTVHISGPTASVNGIQVPDWDFPANTTNWVVRITAKGLSRSGGGPAGGGTETLLTGWPGGADHYDLVPVLQAPALNLYRADPSTNLPGTRVTDVPAPSAAGAALSITIIAGPTTASGILTYGWIGTVTPPTDLTNHYGFELTQQWAGQSEGGTFCTLPANGANPVSFHSDNFYPRGSADASCTFRAYPISRDGVRGTPVTPTVTPTIITASGAYTPPVIPAPAAMTSITVTIIDGPVNAAGIPTYGWTGVIVRPADLTNYNGCVLTQTWDGGNEGAAFQTLGPSQTTFQSDQYYPRQSASHAVVFKAYPISASNQRGTPAATGSLAVTGVATYVPPVVPAPAAMQGISVTITYTQSPAGVQFFGWNGSITLPTDLTNYNGCELTQTWNSDPEGGAFQTLGSGQTTFASPVGIYPRPGVSATCVFKAYPMSRDNQRGTPATQTVTVLAAGQSTLDLTQYDPNTKLPGANVSGTVPAATAVTGNLTITTTDGTATISSTAPGLSMTTGPANVSITPSGVNVTNSGVQSTLSSNGLSIGGIQVIPSTHAWCGAGFNCPTNDGIIGKLTQYNGATTVGSGVPAIHYYAQWSNMSASLAMTSMQVGGNTPPAGMYRISGSLFGGSGGSGNIMVTFYWTDPGGVARNWAMFCGIAGQGTTTSFTFATNGTAIQWNTSYPGSGSYSVNFVLERLV